LTSYADSGSFRIAVFSGAGGGVPDLRAFLAAPAAVSRFVPVVYPGWRRYTDDGFTAEALIRDLANEIAGWRERVAILGVSLGGHIGYAVALQLQNLGIEVVGLCAIDSFVFSSAAVRPGSTGRHVARLRALARRGSLGSLWLLARSLFWRALIRMAGGQVVPWVSRWRNKSWFKAVLAVDPLFQRELSMRLLLRAMTSWLAHLDHDPRPLVAPAAHLRTARPTDDDRAWRVRCPNIEIVGIPGNHDSLLDPENFDAMRQAFALATRSWR